MRPGIQDARAAQDAETPDDGNIRQPSYRRSSRWQSRTDQRKKPKRILREGPYHPSFLANIRLVEVRPPDKTS